MNRLSTTTPSHVINTEEPKMTKYTSIKSFLSERRIQDPDTGAGAAEDAKSDTETVLTNSILTDDEDAIDTSMMDFQEIESLRDQDPFMYHSIVQHQRRRFRGVHFEDGDNNSPRPNVAFERLEESRIILEDDIEVNYRIDSGSDLTNDDEALSGTDLEQQLPPSRRPPRRRTQSLHPTRAPSTHRLQRRFSQSFSCFSTGVVTRQRRVTTECHSSLIIADSDVISALGSLDLTSSVVDTLFADSGGSDVDNVELDALFSE